MSSVASRPEVRAETKIASLVLVIWMAAVMSALRLAIWVASELILWHLYGRTTVERLHLRIVKIKPELVVSNGDVLRGFGFYHYLIGVAIWLPLAIALLSFIFQRLLSKRHQEMLQRKNDWGRQMNAFAVLGALALFFLIGGLLPLSVALSLGGVTVICGSIWARKIQDSSDGIE